MHLRRGTLTAAIAVFAGPALADSVLPVSGAFGNEAGCALYFTGDRSATDLAVLTPHTFTTHDLGCTFASLVSTGEGGYGIAGSCAPTGGKGDAATIAVEGNDADGYAVTIGDDSWGPLMLCPGTEALFGPPGVQV